MTGQKRTRSLASSIARVVIGVALVSVVATAYPAQAQTFNVLHTFTGGQDGMQPSAGLTMDGAGNLYGTTLDYGDPTCSCGTVFKLSP